MGIEEQKETYDGFLKGTKVGVIGTIGVLIILLIVYAI